MFANVFNFRTAATVDQSQIRHLAAPIIPLRPYFRFEWHKDCQKVYVVDIVKGELSKRPVGNVMAFNIDNEGAAFNATLIWCRGYLAAKEDRSHNDQGKLVCIGEHS